MDRAPEERINPRAVGGGGGGRETDSASDSADSGQVGFDSRARISTASGDIRDIDDADLIRGNSRKTRENRVPGGARNGKRIAGSFSLRGDSARAEASPHFHCSSLEKHHGRRGVARKIAIGERIHGR